MLTIAQPNSDSVEIRTDSVVLGGTGWGWRIAGAASLWIFVKKHTHYYYLWAQPQRLVVIDIHVVISLTKIYLQPTIDSNQTEELLQQ